MIDDRSVTVGQIHVLTGGVGRIDLIEHLGDRAVLHIDEQYAGARHTVEGKLRDPAERNHPVVPVVWIIKEILYMRQGEVQVFHLILRADKPGFPCHIEIRFDDRTRRCGDQVSARGKQRKGNQGILVCLVKEVHRFIDISIREVLILDHRVIHRIRQFAHTEKLVFQCYRCPLRQLFRALHHHASGTVGKLPVKRHTDEQNCGGGNRSKTRQDDHIDRQRHPLPVFFTA